MTHLTKKRIISLFICLSMVLSLFTPIASGAEEIGWEEDTTLHYEYEVVGTDCIVTQYTGEESVVYVPSQIDGYTVVEIGNNAFANCYYISEIYLPETVVLIGEEAFMGCDSLIRVDIPDGVHTIGSRAFYNCINMTEADLPSSISMIDVGTFAYCYSLTSIDIPENVTAIGMEAFADCDHLETVNFPDGLCEIGGSAFTNCTLLKEAAIPDGVYYIGNAAFANCSSLSHVKFPDMLTTICADTFSCCHSLTSIDIPESVGLIESNAFDVSLYEITFNGVQTTMDPYAVDSSTIINGYFGSYAHKYALEYGNQFISMGELTPVTSIDLIHPNKTVYNVGEPFEPAGISMSFMLDDGSSIYVSEEYIETYGFDSTYPGTCTVTASYLGHSADFQVEISGGTADIVEYYISEGETLSIYNDSNVKTVVKFSPAESGIYIFVSYSASNTICSLYNSYGDEICISGGTDVDPNFCIEYYLEACEEYSFYPSFVDEYESGYYDVCLTKLYMDTECTHSNSTWYDEVPANCMDSGYTAGVWCDDCSEWIEGREYIESTGEHDYYEELVQEPSCTEQGIVRFTCNYCGDCYEEYEEPLGHDCYEYVVPPTCHSEGFTDHYCSRCDYQYSDNFVPPLEHEYSEHRCEPSCEVDGYVEYRCYSCSEYYTEIIYAPGHAYFDEDVSPTCYDYGFTRHVCTVCGYYYEDNFTEPTGHYYEVMDSIEPGCETDGYTNFVCVNCGESYGEPLPAKGHSFDSQFYPATDYENGHYLFTCYICGYSYKEYIGEHEHDYIIAETVSSDCTNEGYVTYRCQICSDGYIESIPPSGHTPGYEGNENVVDATCTTNGHYEFVKYCGTCNGEISRVLYMIPAYGHTPGYEGNENVVDATCTIDGYYDFVVYCATCYGEISRVTEIIPAPGHRYVMTESVEPSCTEYGYMHHTCELCGDVYTEYFDALDHDYSDYQVIQEYSCEQDGIYHWYCINCGDYYEEIEYSFGHEYDYEVIVEESCTMEGIYRWYCLYCDDYYDEIVPVMEHEYDYIQVVEPTCTEEGIGRWFCVNCDVYYEEIELPYGHDYSDDQVIQEPSCTEDGLIRWYCIECGAYEEEIEPAWDHDYWDEYIQEPTCTEQGIIRWTCDYCGDSYEEIELPYDHDYSDYEVLEEPSCTEDGVYRWYCSECGDYYDEIVYSEGHDYWDYETIKESTCTEDGLIRWYCSFCDYYYDEIEYSDGHSFDDGVVVVESTCSSEGQLLYTCGLCGYEELEYIELADHKHDIYELLYPATCEEDGEEKWTCSVCGDWYTDYIWSLGHKMTEPHMIREATCSQTGIYGSYCTREGCDKTVHEYFTTAEHSFEGQPVVLVEGNCTVDRMEALICSVCGAAGYGTVSDEYFPSFTGDKYTDNMNEFVTYSMPGAEMMVIHFFRASSLEDGYDWLYIYSGDEMSADALVATLTGDFGEQTVVVYSDTVTFRVTSDYSVTSFGFSVKMMECYYGDAYFITKAEGHSIIENTVPPTCISDGYTVYSCENCDYSYTDNYVPSYDHDYMVEVQEPTCNEEGYRTYTCSVCGDQYTEIIPSPPHQYVQISVTGSLSCTVGGSVLYACEICGHEYREYSDPIGHSYEPAYVYAPTCTSEGYTVYVCGRCKDYYTGDFVPAYDHDYSVERIEPTCTIDGSETWTCNECGYSYISAIIVAKGHKTITTVIEPTCTEEGYSLNTCENCDYRFIFHQVQPLGHVEGEWVVVKEATATEQGLRAKYCTVCGEELESEIVPVIVIDDIFGYDPNGENRILTNIPEFTMPVEIEKHYYALGVETVVIEDASGNYPEYVGTGCKVYLNGVEYRAVVKGDFDGNGKINMVDVFNLNVILKQITEPDELQAIALDVTGEGKINAIDAFNLRYRIAFGSWRS